MPSEQASIPARVQVPAQQSHMGSIQPVPVQILAQVPVPGIRKWFPEPVRAQVLDIRKEQVKGPALPLFCSGCNLRH